MKRLSFAVLLLAIPSLLQAQSDLERQQARQAREQAARQQEEAIRTQELNAQNERLLRDAAQQRLDTLAQQYQSSVAYGGTPSERAVIQQQMRDQQTTLRSIEQRQNLTEQQVQIEIDRLRTNLNSANAAGLLSAYAIQQRELIIRQHEDELERMRAERQANAAARALADRQTAAGDQRAAGTVEARALLAAASHQGQLAASEAEGRVLRLREMLSKSATTWRDPQRGIVVTPPGLLFTAGGLTLEPAARTALNAIAKVLAADPQAKVTVEGYTDNAGNATANLRISETRARVVRDYLVGAGVAASRIGAVGKGGVDPVASNMTEAGRQQNRRVEIVIQP
jgi:outer membrane protein OmpA-like peptidoglycan-associated protein